MRPTTVIRSRARSPRKTRRKSLSLSLLAAAAVVVAAALALASCRPNETVEGQARDSKIKTQIKAKLASDVGAATITALSVDVTNGVVTLAGPVHSEDEKARVEAVAKSIPGVASVNNALQVQSAPAPAGGMTTAPGAAPALTPTLAVPPLPTP
jgi:osmotically-inducible protein OsmY